ncbi:hypothetical protein BBO99_00001150 [Phytophthora kernoviae]|uniref:Uncharacterized protein n=2 Tax=Phytophthora kernoviae TaxID=325452 RepID=A0A3R7MRL1_9STRA|nr:hypothetical protein G195_008746 [Phytophthora kernoviae 00238/432]KAG2529665.1 hypothetical protein JM18_001381 [Phytophthora kernoviae]KAG2531147.1 hypothetical protein JM16_001245 [Phytophthora kernoviae]RLN26641.1 hypothetical protein BBI17_004085 [Phytophthora kernoviae]RLN84645.1 hypothetical protein BBO99_00001150 [Phytophthora kernoviae]
MTQQERPESPAGSKRLAPRVPQVTAAAAAARGPRHKKLKWRTRDQQTSRLYNLQLDLHDLRKEIKALEDYEQVLRTHTMNQREQLDDYYIKRVMQYHKVFEHGYDRMPNSANNGGLSSVDAVDFVQQLMEDEVTVGCYTGREVIIDQWERYTEAFPGLKCRLTQSQIASSDEVTIVSATASYSFEITQTTIEALFPRVLVDQPQIGTKLLGRQFQGVDFFKVFAGLLQDSNELCTLFDGAAISEEYFIGRVSIRSCDGGDDKEVGQGSSSESHKLQLEHILDK